MQKPKRLPKVIAKNSWVWEYSPNDYKTSENPGWGPCAGRVLDPFGATLSVHWADAQILPIPRKLCRVAMEEGALVDENGAAKTVHYTDTGVVLRDVVPATPTPSPRKKKVADPKRSWKGRTGFRRY